MTKILIESFKIVSHKFIRFCFTWLPRSFWRKISIKNSIRSLLTLLKFPSETILTDGQLVEKSVKLDFDALTVRKNSSIHYKMIIVFWPSFWKFWPHLKFCRSPENFWPKIIFLTENRSKKIFCQLFWPIGHNRSKRTPVLWPIVTDQSQILAKNLAPCYLSRIPHRPLILLLTINLLCSCSLTCLSTGLP